MIIIVFNLDVFILPPSYNKSNTVHLDNTGIYICVGEHVGKPNKSIYDFK